jgi:hypothetical protein
MDENRDHELIDAIALNCAVCGQDFSICKSCWRNQKCCSKACSLELKHRRDRSKQKRYASTEKGLEFGRLRQQRRYEKIKLLKKSTQSH